MGSFKTFAAAGVMSLAFATGSAFAADLLSAQPPMMPVAPVPVEVGGGWYLRGDVGVSAYNRPRLSSPDAPPALFYGEEMGSGAFAGVGVGYQFSRWFRADVTGEYRFSSQVKAFDKVSFPGGDDGTPGTNLFETTEGKYSSTVGMVNGYFDLGNFHGVTPFVGAGVGVAYNRFYGLSDSTLVVDGFGVASPSGGTISEGSKTNFAWALHAGLAYDVTPNFKVELAYRYMNLGEGRTGVINCFCGSTFSPIKVKDIESHDVKLGMRWVLGGPVASVMPAPEPLVRRY
jgi:opacity protein-like surface antigen